VFVFWSLTTRRFWTFGSQPLDCCSRYHSTSILFLSGIPFEFYLRPASFIPYFSCLHQEPPISFEAPSLQALPAPGKIYTPLAAQSKLLSRGTMAQPHEAFHPSSPPSDGGAESYNHDGTPETRLTAFSPLEDSSKSSRLFSALSLGDGTARDGDQPIGFHSPGIRHVNSPTSFVPGAQEKDPFVSSPPDKRQTKLSATASAFKPLSTPVVSTPVIAYGSSSATPKPFEQAAATVSTCPKTGLPLAPALSHNMGVTRSLRISSSDGVTVNAVEQYLQVSAYLPSGFWYIS
jgi:hypothetical protein